MAGWFSAAQQRSARLLEQSRSELEERVAARTAELERVNQELRAAIAEHQVTEGTLRERTAQLNELFDRAMCLLLCVPSRLLVVSPSVRPNP